MARFPRVIATQSLDRHLGDQKIAVLGTPIRAGAEPAQCEDLLEAVNRAAGTLLDLRPDYSSPTVKTSMTLPPLLPLRLMSRFPEQ